MSLSEYLLCQDVDVVYRPVVDKNFYYHSGFLMIHILSNNKLPIDPSLIQDTPRMDRCTTLVSRGLTGRSHDSTCGPVDIVPTVVADDADIGGKIF